MASDDKPVVLISGAAGGIGRALAAGLQPDYTVVGIDLVTEGTDFECHEIDLTSPESCELVLGRVAERHGRKLASVVHLAAYFDFTGEDNPAYEKVNVEGTRNLLRALRDFEVGQFVYSGTMLVHKPCKPGERIDEDAPIAPKWAYPKSKARTEEVIREEHGDMPCVLLHLAGLYDDRSAVPTLSQQIARIYERRFKSHFYPGDFEAGQSMVHRDDVVDAFRRTIDRRGDLPEEVTILVGEPEAMGFERLQDTLGRLIHGKDEWATIRLPKPLAKVGAWAEAKAEPLIPDAIDQGEKPFIRPFMVEMSDDHYALRIDRARELLGWEPEHRLEDVLPDIVAALKDDPLRWYRDNGITPPPELEEAGESGDDAEALRQRHEREYRRAHRAHLWGHFANIGLGSWLLTSPPLLGYAGTPLAISDYASGVAAMVLGMLSLSWRMPLARWGCAAVGLWVLFAPLVFWTGSAAGYLNSTLVGSLLIGFSFATRPPPGVAAIAARTGPEIPLGWEFSPSTWMQRAPIIMLAFVGLYISRYLTAYQLGHIDAVWEPFFAGGPDPKNGTEEIITSSVSEAWPVPDAGVGALTYLLEILTGLMGSSKRWRTMPWLVMAFGFMIVPLGAVSITFIIIQPIMLGTWCTLCLVGAAAMLIQIPYSLDELVASTQFLVRRKRAGRPLLRVFFLGDTDEGEGRERADFEQSPVAILKDMWGGGVTLPWNLLLTIAIGLWLMFTRLTLGTTGSMANADHLIGALMITVTVTALAESARALRFLNIGFGIALLVTPFAFGAGTVATLASLACGAAVIALSFRRGPVRHSYGSMDRFIF